MNCPACAALVSATNRFCPSCGKTLDLDASPTILGSSLDASPETLPSSSPAPPPRAPIRAQIPTPTPTPTTGRDGRLLPGTILAERYRVVALAGKGGMGEVYRAEDIRLEQEVALKFLPASLAQDAAALARFHREVRIARQVSHANVCRVFDIGDAGGIPFLSMEYVDGEDLGGACCGASAVSRRTKALEIARQVLRGPCGGARTWRASIAISSPAT